MRCRNSRGRPAAISLSISAVRRSISFVTSGTRFSAVAVVRSVDKLDSMRRRASVADSACPAISDMGIGVGAGFVGLGFDSVAEVCWATALFPVKTEQNVMNRRIRITRRIRSNVSFAFLALPGKRVFGCALRDFLMRRGEMLICLRKRARAAVKLCRFGSLFKRFSKSRGIGCGKQQKGQVSDSARSITRHARGHHETPACREH